jgi:alpha-tubulin suppressor-like RCC1 family protein
MPVLRRLLSRVVPLSLLAALPLALSAQGTVVVTAGTSTKVQLAPGTKFKVPITLDVTSAGTAAVASLGAELDWDPNGLTIDSVTAGTFGTLTKPIIRSSAGIVTVAVFSATPASGSTTIANVWFTASATVAGTQLHLDISNPANTQGAELSVNTSTKGMDVCVAPLGKWGDVNNDAAVNILDAQQIARSVVGLSLADTNTFSSTGDVNADSSVNVIDAQQIARFAIGLSAPSRTATDAFVVPAIAAIVVSPSGGLNVGTGSSAHVRLKASSASGAPLAGCLPVTWKSSDTTKVKVTDAGDVSGIAAGSATLTAKIGLRTVTVAATVATGTSGNTAVIEIVKGDGQVAGAGAIASISPVVRLKDSFGTPQPGATVRFTATTSGSYIGASGVSWVDVTADTLGYATLENWTLPSSGTTAQLTAQAGTSPTTTLTANLFATPASEHSCAVIASAGYCWGNGLRGQLGNGASIGSSYPVAVSGGLAFTSISTNVRGDHSCGVTTSGQGYCWGANSGGQLGDSTQTDRNVPVLVKGNLTWSRISTGITSSCGLTTGGALYCWGWGQYGQLGDSTAGLVRTGPIAVKMPAGTTVTNFSTGGSSACAVTSVGDVYCWGFGGPSLGNGGSEQKNVPTKVINLTGATKVSMGTTHACALVTSGAAYCWGGGGPLGDGSTGISRATPTAVVGGHVFTEINAGNRNTCALKNDTSVWCWGFNGSAQLGDSTAFFRAIPTPIPLTASQLIAGGANGTQGDHRCALSPDGRGILCWGQGSSGQLGDGSSQLRRIPTSVFLANATSGAAVSIVPTVASFRPFATVGTTVTTPPSVVVRDARGFGVQGATVTFSVVSGGGSMTGASVTTDVNGAATVGSWTLGSTAGANVAQAAVTLASGTVAKAFFYGTGGAAITAVTKISGDSIVLTNQPVSFNALPTVQVTGAGGVGVPGATVNFVLNSVTTPILTDSLGYASLPSPFLTPTTSPPTTNTTLTASSGAAPSVSFTILAIQSPVGSPGNRNSACGLAKSGIVYCWGQNNFGQLGNGTTTQRNYADSVSGGLRFSKLSLQNGGHHCALTSTGAAYCWGDNVFGQVGDGTTTTRLVPTAVLGGLTFTQIITQNETTCALTSAGAVYCWGYLHASGMFNVSLRDRRVLTPTLANTGSLAFTQIALWDQGLCGLTAAGVAYCGGDNSTGTVGNGTFIHVYDGLVQVTGGLTFRKIAGGTGTICGVTLDGLAYCWGSSNASGGLGDGTALNRFAPTPLADDGGRFSDIMVVNFSGCGLRIDGTATCWGVNNLGQVGNGDLSGGNVYFPQEIPGLKFTDLSIGSFRGKCGVVQSGSMYCWGSHSNGQLGDSSTVGSVTGRPVPVAVVGWPDGPAAGVPATISPTTTWSKLVTGTAGSNLTSPPSVVVKDRLNQPVVGVTVTFAIESGPGTLVGSIVQTDATGTATATRFTVGSTYSDGPTTITAKVAGLAPAYMMVSPSLTISSATIAFGDQQRNFAGITLPGYLGVLVKDQYGNPMANQGISFSITSGGGTLSAPSAATDASGIARVSYTPSATPGTTSTITATNGTVTSNVFTVFTPLNANIQDQCELATTGAAYCWGDNSRGQIGDGTTTQRPSPTAVSGGLIFSSLSTGFGDHTCGLTATGVAYCWGSNAFGELGDSTTTDRTAPVAVKGGLTFSAITVSSMATCGLTTAGAMYCWGSRDQGLLGDGVLGGYITTPSQVNTGGVTFKAIGIGRNIACGLSTGGTAYCWQGGGFTGDGTAGGSVTASVFSVRTTPTAIQDGRTYASLTVGEQYACAIATTGTTYCWGANSLGQLGDGTTVGKTSPVAVNTTRTFTKIVAGQFHTCGLEANGTLSCWGRNADGRSGDGTNVFKTVPTLVTGGLTFSSIRLNGGNTCAKATTSGVPFCWGGNAAGYLGIGSTTPSNSNVPLQTNWVQGTAGTATSVRAQTSPLASYARSTVLTNALSVKVRDFAGNPVVGTTVTFAVTGGGGTITTASVVTDSTGVAVLPNWTLGATAGTNTLTATVSGIGFVLFTVTGT